MIQPRKLDTTVQMIQEIRDNLRALDIAYNQLNEDSMKALKTNPDYNDVVDFNKSFIEFK